MSIETTVDLPEWPEILRACQQQLAERIHTSLPGIVQSYNATVQTAVVQLAVQLRGATVPALADVPVVWPGGSSNFVHMDLAANDTVMVLFSEEDFGPWLVSGSVSAPAVLARHGLHAVALPGLRRTALAVTGGHATIGVASELRLGDDTATAAVALAPALLSLKTALDTAFTTLNALSPGISAAWSSATSTFTSTVPATKVKAK